MMRRSLFAVAALAAMLAPMAAAAVPAALPDPGGSDPAAAASEPATPQIDTESTTASDRQIARRITGIFAAIEPLRSVEVAVEQGVVTLSGSVARAESSEQAEAIAGRVSGVVTVENGIERDLAVERNLAPTFDALGDRTVSLIRSLPLLAVAIALAAGIMLAGYGLARAKGLWRRITPNAFLAELVASAIRFLAVLLGLYAALKLLGATALLGALLGAAGVIGVAIGFAVRDTIDNYISSVMLSLRQPFRANDHVVIDGEEGRVVRLTSRATLLMTLDGNHLRIPNATVFKAVILNYTRNPQRRFGFQLGIDADDDPVEGMATAIDALCALPFVLGDPQPSAVIQQVGDSNIVLEFFGWVDQGSTDFLKARSLAIKAVKSALEDAGFALPEPIYRLRFDQGGLLRLPVGQPAGEGMPTADRSAGGEARDGEGAAAQMPRPRQRRVTDGAAADAQSTGPENHIANLVARERAETGEGDLLDEKRPIE